MTSQRPGFLDLRSQSQNSVTRPLKSPRLHVAGDVPPELSPLDAFALQSRLLARQLEESAKDGRRVSRLPPLTTESPLIMQGRSDYFRSMSYDAGDDQAAMQGDSPVQPKSATSQPMTPSGFSMRTPEVEEPSVRPMSMHPRMSRVPFADDLPPPVPDYAKSRFSMQQNQDMPFNESDELEEQQQPQPQQQQQQQQQQPSTLFGARRERSPSPFSDRGRDLQVAPDEQLSPDLEQSEARRLGLQPLNPSSTSLLSQSPEKSVASKNSFDSSSGGGLAPPRNLFPKRSSSIMSSPYETDADGHSFMNASMQSLGAARKLSTSSGMMSPGFGSFQRSPSISSDMSAPLPRPSFNFSRPISRVGTPGLESPARQASSDSHTSYSQSSFMADENTANTPVSMNSDGFFPDPTTAAVFDDGRGPAPSYIYSKFALPRGKSIERERSRAMHDTDGRPATASAAMQWEHQPSMPHSNMQTLPLGGQAPPSPPTRPSSSSGNMISRPSLERSKLNTEVLLPTSEPSPNPSRSSTDGDRSSEDAPRGRSMTTRSQDTAASAASAASAPSAMSAPRGRTPASTRTAVTTDTASTVKPRSMRSLATATEISAEEHVEKAIKLHEDGQLNESTYHLRHAARQGHPTGMLLYALACRHGWGMRANPREGAEWLRKAADCASIEIADDEALIKEGKLVDSVDRKTRKAQFALSIYELGVSYMNGWGIDQDKPLALRCFEIAGSWGDVDALAETGFCYAQGVGCKKDLKKSARFYRQAEEKGMSMIGNSWIHKAKYNDDKDSKKKSRSKSRTRTRFGMKHGS